MILRFASAVQVSRHDIGGQVLFAVGPCSGGELWVYGKHQNKLITKNRFVVFQGAAPHTTMGFEGTPLG